MHLSKNIMFGYVKSKYVYFFLRISIYTYKIRACCPSGVMMNEDWYSQVFQSISLCVFLSTLISSGWLVNMNGLAEPVDDKRIHILSRFSGGGHLENHHFGNGSICALCLQEVFNRLFFCLKKKNCIFP